MGEAFVVVMYDIVQQVMSLNQGLSYLHGNKSSMTKFRLPELHCLGIIYELHIKTIM